MIQVSKIFCCSCRKIVEEIKNITNDNIPKIVICDIGPVPIHENLDNPLHGPKAENIVDSNEQMSPHSMDSNR